MRNKKIRIYTPGVFDCFHIGHLRHLQFAKKQGDILIVGIRTDEFTKKRKGQYPAIPLEHRIEILKGLSCVDEIIIRDKMDFVEEMKLANADIFVGSNSYKNVRGYYNALKLYIEKTNKKLILSNYTQDISSTKIKERIISLFK